MYLPPASPSPLQPTAAAPRVVDPILPNAMAHAFRKSSDLCGLFLAVRACAVLSIPGKPQQFAAVNRRLSSRASTRHLPRFTPHCCLTPPPLGCCNACSSPVRHYLSLSCPHQKHPKRVISKKHNGGGTTSSFSLHAPSLLRTAAGTPLSPPTAAESEGMDTAKHKKGCQKEEGTAHVSGRSPPFHS